VNGDDPEAVVHVARIATEFRQTFNKDVVIDIYCYRRFGHNEGDEPSFTQPLMYRRIGGQDSTRTIYGRQLIAENVVTRDEFDEMKDEFQAHLENAFRATESFKPNKSDFLGGQWEGLKIAEGQDRRGKTGLSDEQAERIGKILTTIPEGFNLHRKLQRFVDARR
jgi:2-oxoglutarate dehydrogenase E1 component